MSDDLTEDDDSVAWTIVYHLKNAVPLEGDGWVIDDSLFDDFELQVPSGQRFRVTVEEITEDAEDA